MRGGEFMHRTRTNSTVVLQPSSWRTGLVGELKNLQKENANSETNKMASKVFLGNLTFELSVNPDKVFEEVDNFHSKSTSILYGFSVEKYSDSHPLDVGLTWMIPVVWSCQQARLHASRFLMGSGKGWGAIAIYF
ncbi:hypothetical protein Ddye_030863 [Dipteronia dyeriana]|uniref:Uncharacterized protein n=1 Tax=Dipteronia dyeriana TaxID=168575 RepID=A0AAD9THF7_9ROSI|nr:hypothetical protein Ddye_030863 [Dipteronia dyeriana]